MLSSLRIGITWCLNVMGAIPSVRSAFCDAKIRHYLFFCEKIACCFLESVDCGLIALLFALSACSM